MIFVDFSKAFDVANHQLLLTKLRLYRPSDSTLSWFTSYLTKREQFVTISGQRLDPLRRRSLFLFVNNNIPLQLSRSSVDIFADDTTNNT